MGKLIGFKKKKKKGGIAGAVGYRSSRVPSSPKIARSSGRPRRRRGILGFVRRNLKLVSIAGGVVVIAVICIVLFAGGADTTATAQPAETAEVMPADNADDYDYANYDPDVLAGLTGSDESLFTSEEDMEELLFEQEGIRIGVTVGNLASGEDEDIINRLEEVWDAAESSKEIYNVYYYNAYSNPNQQLQDFRSLVNNEVDVIIVAFTDVDSFNMLAMMAEREGIPVVAYDAPVDSGYAVNMVPDLNEWGRVYGQFMAQKLGAGNVLAVLGDQESPRVAARKTAITTALAANTQLSLFEPVYAGGNAQTAKAAVAALLEDGKTIDGVIVEEGMGQAVLEAFIEARKLPKVMCGDATAGFIKKWYALKSGGVDVTPKAAKNEPEPTPEFFAAQPGEFLVCVQPSPTGGAAAAFEIAVELAKGRKLKNEGQTVIFAVKTLINDTNLATYYQQVKEREDEATVNEYLADTVLDSLLHPLEQ